MGTFTFLVYHAALSPQGVDAIADIYEHDPAVNWRGRWAGFKENFLPYADRYIETFFKSVRRVHPDCRCVVLTDLKTEFRLSEEISIVRRPLDPDAPAYMRLLAQKDYLERAFSDTHHFFLDYDMLVQKNLSFLCSQDFDIGLAYQSNGFRIEGSFFLVRQGAEKKGVQFLDKVEETFKAHFPSKRIWGGIEASMNRLVSASPKKRNEEIGFLLDNMALRLFPGDLYSYPFYQQDLVLGIEYLPEKPILHFRGDIKAQMLEYWKLYMSA